MLLYYLFWMFMGFILHIYIIFGTNLLTGGLARIAVFFLFQYFEGKEYQTESKRNETFGGIIFWNERDPEDLGCKSRSSRGSHEGGGCAHPYRARPLSHGPLGRPPAYFFLLYILPYPENIGEHHEKYFHRRNLLYLRDPILEPSPTLHRRRNRPWRASPSSPRPLR